MIGPSVPEPTQAAGEEIPTSRPIPQSVNTAEVSIGKNFFFALFFHFDLYKIFSGREQSSSSSRWNGQYPYWSSFFSDCWYGPTGRPSSTNRNGKVNRFTFLSCNRILILPLPIRRKQTRDNKEKLNEPIRFRSKSISNPHFNRNGKQPMKPEERMSHQLSTLLECLPSHPANSMKLTWNR